MAGEPGAELIAICGADAGLVLGPQKRLTAGVKFYTNVDDAGPRLRRRRDCGRALHFFFFFASNDKHWRFCGRCERHIHYSAEKPDGGE